MSFASNNIFKDIGSKAGLTYDQAKFVLTVALCFPLGYLFRVYFHTRRVSVQTRHLISMLGGAGVLTFCFGRQAAHILASSLLGYTLMLCLNESVVHRFVLITAMLYLSIVHINRMFIETRYVIDISGPLMLATIKITYVGFNIHDAAEENKRIKKDDSNDPISITRPTLLEYFSYIFNFNTVMCGPPPEYLDYKEFIEETQFDKHIKHSDNSMNLSPMIPAVSKLVFGHIMIAVYALLVPTLSPQLLGDEKRLSGSNLLSNIIFAELVIYLMKAKYYAPFFIGEGISNISGLGCNGTDQNGSLKWNKLQNMDPVGLEKARNVKDFSDSWNIITGVWLRKCIYDRVRFMPIVITFFFSAFWHGFYPGYYMFFIPVGIGSLLARKMRRKVRGYFLHSMWTKLFYDISTLIITRMIINFYAAGFTMLNMEGTLRFWRSSYYYGHVILIIGFILSILLPDLDDGKKKNGLKPHSDLSVKKTENSLHNQNLT